MQCANYIVPYFRLPLSSPRESHFLYDITLVLGNANFTYYCDLLNKQNVEVRWNKSTYMYYM